MDEEGIEEEITALKNVEAIIMHYKEATQYTDGRLQVISFNYLTFYRILLNIQRNLTQS